MPIIRIDLEKLREESKGERGEVWLPGEAEWTEAEIVDICEVRKIPFLNMEGWADHAVFKVRIAKTGEEVCVTPTLMREFKKE